MKIRLIHFWDQLRSSYWFIPSLMAGGAVLLSFLLLELDSLVLTKSILSLGWIYHGGAAGARDVLSSIASSMITVAGVVFSVTIVALSMASTQFGPRLLRGFIRDRGSQVVFGTFLATFMYCLLILRTIRDADGEEFVPYISVTVGILLAMLSLAVLIYFIHHAAVSIQVARVVAGVAEELAESIDVLFPTQLGRSIPSSELYQPLPERFEEESCPIIAAATGYVQVIDDEALLEIACKHELIIFIQHRPGSFVIEGTSLARAWPGERVNDRLAGLINDLFILGAQRVPIQDVEFALHQLVEVALRAMSPAINDPFTASSCVDWIGAALRRLADRPLPSPFRYDEDGKLRVVVETPLTFPGLVNSAFDQIRYVARHNVYLSVHMLEVIADIAAYVHNDDDRAALLRQATMIERASQREIVEEWDRELIQSYYYKVLDAVGEADQAVEAGADEA